MLDPGDAALMREAFKAELYPALDKQEARMVKTIGDAITLHHANCSMKETVQRFEISVTQTDSKAEQAAKEAREAKAKASNAELQATQVKEQVSEQLNRFWGGWKTLLAIGGILGLLFSGLEALSAFGLIHWH
jgi:glutamate-1-semialdehyde aminotransferase